MPLVCSPRAASRTLTLTGALALAAAALPPPAHAQKEPGTDHPLVGRYAGSTLVAHQSKRFDARAFVVKGQPDRSLTAEDLETIEGKSTTLIYQTPPAVSSLEVFRNFQASMKSRGFSEVYACENHEGQPKRCPDPKQISYKLAPLSGGVVESGQCYRNNRYALFRKGREVTVGLLVGECLGSNPPARVWISVTESARMATDQIVVPSAADMNAAFAAEGKIALYGIFFDTGKAEIKPESQPTLSAIAALLAGEPKLNLVITGYTDNVGGFDANVALSKRRAEAVVAALVSEHKVAAARLTAFGAGMTGPRAANTDEAGRAKNRRVELMPR